MRLLLWAVVLVGCVEGGAKSIEVGAGGDALVSGGGPRTTDAGADAGRPSRPDVDAGRGRGPDAATEGGAHDAGARVTDAGGVRPDAERTDAEPPDRLDAAPPPSAVDGALPPPPAPDGAAPLDGSAPPPPPRDAAPPPPPPPPAPAVCGNGVVEAGERCDDGNAVDVDRCNNTCDVARPAPPPIQAFFSDPTPDRPLGPALEAEVFRLIQMAAPGAEVRVAIYEWTNGPTVRPFADALGDALDRGADVRVVLDGGGASDSALARLQARLGADRITRCGGGGATACHGSRINHNKFFLFSALTDGSRDVVVQSSANLNAGQLRKHNNAVVIRGDAALYAAYRQYWLDLRRDRFDLNYYWTALGDSGVKAYFFPRASGDTAVSIVNNVHCDPGASIHVAMAFFEDPRLAVADALGGKREQGCEVRVIIGDYPGGEEPSPGPDVMRVLRDKGVRVRVADAPNLHSKYMLIRARYGDGAAVENLVFTGSHNWTDHALLHNDEAMVKIDNAAVYDAFRANWQLIWDQI